MKTTNSIWKTTDEINTKFDSRLVKYVMRDPNFIADVEKAIPDVRKIYYSPDWNEISDMDTGLRTLCVFIGIKNGNGSQNELCQLALLSPKTYRKYRDKYSSRLAIEYNNYEKAMYEAVKNTLLWNMLAFSTNGRKEIEKLGIENRNIFLRLMKAKEFPYTVECIKECWDSLAQREKDECMSKS